MCSALTQHTKNYESITKRNLFNMSSARPITRRDGDFPRGAQKRKTAVFRLKLHFYRRKP